MKFLLDQDVYPSTKVFLISQGHDILSASEDGLATAEDEKILARAHELNRILIT